MSLLDDESTLLTGMGEKIKENYLWSNDPRERATGRTTRLAGYYVHKYLNSSYRTSICVRDHYEKGSYGLISKIRTRLFNLGIDASKLTVGLHIKTDLYYIIRNNLSKKYSIEVLDRSNDLISQLIEDFYTAECIDINNYSFEDTVFQSSDTSYLLKQIQKVILREMNIPEVSCKIDNNIIKNESEKESRVWFKVGWSR